MANLSLSQSALEVNRIAGNLCYFGMAVSSSRSRTLPAVCIHMRGCVYLWSLLAGCQCGSVSLQP